MSESRHHQDQLRRLGIEEVKQRLELSTLSPAAGVFESPDIDTCCCCKLNEPEDPVEPDELTT